MIRSRLDNLMNNLTCEQDYYKLKFILDFFSFLNLTSYCNEHLCGKISFHSFDSGLVLLC